MANKVFTVDNEDHGIFSALCKINNLKIKDEVKKALHNHIDKIMSDPKMQKVSIDALKEIWCLI